MRVEGAPFGAFEARLLAAPMFAPGRSPFQAARCDGALARTLARAMTRRKREHIVGPLIIKELIT